MNLRTRAATAVRNLPPFPPVAAKVISLLADDSVSFGEVADTLKTDVALTAEVLRLANSSLFTARTQVTSVLQAVSFLGSGRLVGLMLTLSMSKVLRQAKSSEIMRRSWRHNLASALAAKEFAHSFGKETNEAYNAGLFHDIGRLAFLVAEPVPYEAIVRKGGDVQQLEREYFGADHCEAGAWLLKEWKLPKAFSDAARYHHDPTPECDELIMLVNASCILANRTGFSVAIREVDDLQSGGTDKLASSIEETISVLEREYGIGNSFPARRIGTTVHLTQTFGPDSTIRQENKRRT
jgi:HD-like signal output (HDOD) protein